MHRSYLKFRALVIAVSLALVCDDLQAASGPSNLTLQGRIVRPNASGVDAPSVDFSIQIRSPGLEACIVYEELHTLNMSNTDGVFSIRLGSGLRSGTNFKDTSTLIQAFDNSAANITPLVCDSGSSFNPSANDGRKLRVSFNEGSGVQTLSQDQTINSVPYALYSDRVGGKLASELIQTVSSLEAVPGTSQSRVNRLIDTDWSGLDALLNGTSNLYSKGVPTAAVSNNGQRFTNVSDPTSAQDAATKNYSDTKIGSKDLDLTTIGAGVGNGQVLTWNAVTNKWVTSNQLALANGYVGIGTATPDRPLVVHSGLTPVTAAESAVLITGSNGKERLTIHSAGSAPVLAGRSSGGTEAIPAAIANGQNLFRIFGQGYDGASWATGAQMNISTGEVWDATGRGTSIYFSTTENNTTSLSNRFMIYRNGNIGIREMSPTSMLTVGANASQTALAAVRNYAGSGFTNLLSVEDTSGASRLAVQPAGNTGIGTGSPAARLDVTDATTTTSAIIVPRAAAFTGNAVNGMVRYNSVANLFEFRENGAWVNYTTVSDGRLKTNVKPVSNGLDIVNQLNPVFYDWDKRNPRTTSFSNNHEVGFIAQEVEKVLPEVVDRGEDGYRSIEYGKIVSITVDAIQSLHKRLVAFEERHSSEVEALRLENRILKRENLEVKARLDQIERILIAR